MHVEDADQFVVLHDRGSVEATIPHPVQHVACQFVRRGSLKILCHHLIHRGDVDVHCVAQATAQVTVGKYPDDLSVLIQHGRHAESFLGDLGQSVPEQGSDRDFRDFLSVAHHVADRGQQLPAQVAARVMGNHVTTTVAGSSGHLELNAFKPVMIDNLLESIRLLAEGCQSFTDNCIIGIEPNRARIAEHLDQSLMLVTAIAPHIGYENAARIAKKAHAEGTNLRQAALQLGLIEAEEFDRWVRPEDMTAPRP